MTDIWTWTVWTEKDQASDSEQRLGPCDLAGFTVETRDGHIGNVDEATMSIPASLRSTSEGGSAGFIVVDTGFWIFGKKRMVPAGLVYRVDPHGHKVYLACTKAQVKEAPDYDAQRAGDQEHHDDIGRYFEAEQYQGMHGDPIGPTPGTEHEPGRAQSN